jgi:hypothetical protein
VDDEIRSDFGCNAGGGAVWQKPTLVPAEKGGVPTPTDSDPIG